MLAIGTGTRAAPVLRPGGDAAPLPAPAPIFTRVVIEGDSITSTTPQQAGNHGDFYSYTWTDAQTGMTAFVTAQGSRTVGGAAYNGDLPDDGTPAGNTLWAHRSDDLALDPDLITAMIGVNDLSSTGVTVATHIQRLKDWAAAIRAGGVKIAYAPPTPTEAAGGNSQASYDAYIARWSALWTTHDVRDPANWSQWADYYIPMGEHPDFALGGHTTDGVHPSGPATDPATGQGKLLAVYGAAMATLRDPSRISAGGPYESVWDAFGPFDDLAVGSSIARRIILSGLAWAGHLGGVSVTGGDAAVEINGKVAPGYAYNGDVIDLSLTASAMHEADTAVQLTIGGETRMLTFRTAADATPAAYVHGDVAGQAEGDSSLTLTGLTFAAGRAVVMVPTGNTALAAGAVKLNGATMTFRRRETTPFNGCIELWDAPIAAGADHTLSVTYPAWRGNRIVSYGAVTDGAFVSATGNAPADEANPHLTPSVTVPAGGVAVAGFLEYGGASITPATVNGGTTPVDEGNSTFQGETVGIAVATKAVSGTASFNFTFGSFARVIAVYGAG